MPLTLCPPMQTAIIKKIGGDDKTKQFLLHLGFIPGEEVCVVSEIGGNMIVNVKGARIAIDKKLAQKIAV